jgi:nifR3 family TIM-barrel protein
MTSFWHNLPKPIIGLAPMDGITDPPFRAVVDEIGKPSVLYTEFISADGFVRNPARLSHTLTTYPTSTPLVAQLFGANPDTMYEAATLLLKFPIQGIDINMGCPNKHVAKTNGGASLIQNPKLAQILIRKVRKAVKDSGRNIGISVKTRIGYDKPDTREWISTLLEEDPDAIALHGRTFRQMFTGQANWDEIKIASGLASKTKTLLLGNGDIQSLEDATRKSQLYSPDGVLIGRASLGNPWVFTDTVPDKSMKIQAELKHIKFFSKLTPTADVLSLRKHLCWYMKGFPDSSEIRKKIVSIHTTLEAETILMSLIDK